MSPEKTKALFDEFPELYRGKELSMGENLMCFGFQCDNGWFNIIHALSTVIALHAKWHQCGELTYPIAIQVKEKFGGLRFGYRSVDIDAVDGAVDMAEQMSFRTCEMCGAPGQMHHRNNWLKTLCPSCANKNEYILCGKGEDNA